MRPYRDPRRVYVRPSQLEMTQLGTVPEEAGTGITSLESERPGNSTSFLVPLSAIAAVTGALVIPAVQAGVQDFHDLRFTLPAAVSEATIFASYARSTGPKAVMAYLGAALSVMHAVELMSGFGSPNTGGAFHDGSTEYSTTVENILSNAIPDAATWNGDAAIEYAQANSAQQDLVDLIAQADLHMAHRVKYQAEQVEDSRNGMQFCRLALSGTLVVMGVLLTAFIAAAAKGEFVLAQAIAAVADGFGNYFALITLIGDLAMIGYMLSVGEKTKETADAVTGIYQDIVAGAAVL